MRETQEMGSDPNYWKPAERRLEPQEAPVMAATKSRAACTSVDVALTAAV